MKKINNIRKGIISVILSLTMCICLMLVAVVPAYAASSDSLAAATTPYNGSLYYVMVNRQMNTVTVYTLDEKGYYSVPIKAFICSTGRPGHETPTGTFKMGKNQYRWRAMVDGTYAQYACGIWKGIMFHSVCYSRPKADKLITAEYDGLGEVASLGCVRLQTCDAKWIYENCKPGTLVTIYDSVVPGPLGKPDKLVADLASSFLPNWDPTDDIETNPWLIYWGFINQIAASQGK